MAKRMYLEGFVEETDVPRRIVLDTFPYIIGRIPSCPLYLDTGRVSRQHAQIDHVNGQLCLTDLGSTNGTYVNHQRISAPTPLQHGDVVHFAEHEFRVIQVHEPSNVFCGGNTTMVGLHPLTMHFPQQIKEFAELMAQELVRGYHQAIVDVHGQCIGYELLGRGTHPALPASPQALFDLAHALDEGVTLSELLRRQCLADAQAMGLQGLVFFNTHPKECQKPERLLHELHTLRHLYPALHLICEIHEGAVTDLQRMAEIRDGLRELDIGLAYDDFGAGQARLLELVEVPPDILKFDRSLIAGLTGPESSVYRLVATLVKMVEDMHITTLAEGVETTEVAQTCVALGIQYLQGFLFSKPAPIVALHSDTEILQTSPTCKRDSHQLTTRLLQSAVSTF